MTNTMLGRTAVIYVVGSTPESTLESNGLQVGIDHVNLAAPISKWTCKVHSVVRSAASWLRRSASRRSAAGPRPARHPGRRPRRRRDVDPRRSAAPLAAAAPSADAVAALPRAAHESGAAGALAGRCPGRGARVACNELLEVTASFFADYGAMAPLPTTTMGTGAPCTSSVAFPKATPGRGAHVGCALRLRHAGVARRRRRMGYDRPAGRQRRRRGRSVRSRGAGRHRGAGGDDEGARGEES